MLAAALFRVVGKGNIGCSGSRAF